MADDDKRRARRSRFFRILVLVTAGVHVPFAIAVSDLLRRLGESEGVAWGVAAALGALGVYLFFGRAQHLMNDRPRAYWRVAAADLPYYAHWSACIYCLVPSIAYVVVAPIVELARGAPVGYSASFFFWCYASGLVVCAYGVTVRRWWFVVKKVDVPIRDLPPAFDGYRIAQLSDLHVGAQTPPWWAERWIRASNAKKPDLVAVTGDMVTSGVAFHEDIAALVGGLEAKDGTYVIMGNHDYFGEGEPLVSLLRARGAKVLRNEGVVLSRDAGKMYLAGIDDTWTRRADVERALADRPENTPAVLLAHDPERFREAAAKDVDLTLSGHTHGGQIALPFFARRVNASKLAHSYHNGAYREGRSMLYVSPGLGTTGPPIRLGAAPAIVLFTLRRAPAGAGDRAA